ncbi:MAG: nucleotidyl transferase AbiEii/AbiGii toxin family protein [Sedimentibacter sp.]
MISAESVKARLKNQASKRGHILQEELTAYVLERTIYRISISDYVDKFTLKGGIFLYALFEGNFTRVTTDIDLLAQMISNETDNIKRIFDEIFSIEVDDALRYDLKSLDVHTITEFKKYPGVNVSITVYLDKSRIQVSIDIGFGDVIYPERVLMDFPVLLDMETPRIYVYSIASVVAEKLEAIVVKIMHLL